MMTPRSRQRVPHPIDAAALRALALAYVARFATTRAKLTIYLQRKLAVRGWEGEDGAQEAVVAAVVEYLCDAGYIDDAGFARARSAGLLRRGYGGRRIAQALGAAGVEADTREAMRPDATAARGAALALARKRRFGPFGPDALDRARREKQIAAMLRAGHALDTARQVVDATSVEAAERWAMDEDAQ